MDCEGVILGKMYQARSLDRVVDDIQLILTSKRKEKKRKEKKRKEKKKEPNYNKLERKSILLSIHLWALLHKSFSRPLHIVATDTLQRFLEAHPFQKSSKFCPGLSRAPLGLLLIHKVCGFSQFGGLSSTGTIFRDVNKHC